MATSLDGYIAGERGEFDWIVTDPDIDFAALFAQFDTAVMGRKTFLATGQQGGSPATGSRSRPGRPTGSGTPARRRPSSCARSVRCSSSSS